MKWFRLILQAVLFSAIVVVAYRSLSRAPYGVDDARERKLLAQLGAGRKTFVFDQAPQDEVTKTLSEAYGTRCEYYWGSLPQSSGDHQIEMTFSVTDAPLVDALEATTTNIIVRDEAFVFCSTYQSVKDQTVRIYDVRTICNLLGGKPISWRAVLNAGPAGSRAGDFSVLFLRPSIDTAFSMSGTIQHREMAGHLVVTANSYQHLVVAHRLTQLHDELQRMTPMYAAPKPR